MFGIPSEDQDLPRNVKNLLRSFDDQVFADFTVCSLKQGTSGYSDGLSEVGEPRCQSARTLRVIFKNSPLPGNALVRHYRGVRTIIRQLELLPYRTIDRACATSPDCENTDL
jgi:hypothetical protein